MKTTALVITVLLIATLGPIASAQETQPDNKCNICGMIDCQMGCKAENVNAQGERIMVMPGIPGWMFYTGIGAILAVMFFALVLGLLVGPEEEEPEPSREEHAVPSSVRAE